MTSPIRQKHVFSQGAKLGTVKATGKSTLCPQNRASILNAPPMNSSLKAAESRDRKAIIDGIVMPAMLGVGQDF